MKRSISSSYSSASSSCVESNDPLQQQHQEQPPENELRPNIKTYKRAKRAQNQENSSNANPAKRSSIYRGVTRHRKTGRFEAHLWDKYIWNSPKNKKGKQIYLGAFDTEENAARTYDLASLKCWGLAGATLNFPGETYTKEIEEMQKPSREEYLASLRRLSSGFSRGTSQYRGVARHHYNGRWEARIGRVAGKKYLYLGTYSTEEEAAAAYDMAAIQQRGPNAVTNFDISNYVGKIENMKPVEAVQESSIEVHQPVVELELQSQEMREESSVEGQLEELWNRQETQEEFLMEDLSLTLYDHQPIDDDEAPAGDGLITQEDLDAFFADYVYQHEEKPLIHENSESVAVMNPENHQHPWDFGFHSPSLDDQRHTQELPELVNDIDMSEDLDLIFASEPFQGIDLNQDPRFNLDLEAQPDVSVVKEEKGQEASTSTSLSSPLSSTTKSFPGL